MKSGDDTILLLARRAPSGVRIGWASSRMVVLSARIHAVTLKALIPILVMVG